MAPSTGAMTDTSILLLTQHSKPMAVSVTVSNASEKENKRATEAKGEQYRLDFFHV